MKSYKLDDNHSHQLLIFLFICHAKWGFPFTTLFLVLLAHKQLCIIVCQFRTWKKLHHRLHLRFAASLGVTFLYHLTGYIFMNLYILSDAQRTEELCILIIFFRNKKHVRIFFCIRVILRKNKLKITTTRKGQREKW